MELSGIQGYIINQIMSGIAEIAARAFKGHTYFSSFRLKGLENNL